MLVLANFIIYWDTGIRQLADNQVTEYPAGRKITHLQTLSYL